MQLASNLPEMKIGVISSTYARHHDDYAVPWMRESLARLAGRGHRTTVIAPSYRGLQSHQIDDVDVHRFRYAPASWETLTHEQGAPNKVHSIAMQALAAPYTAAGSLAALRVAKRECFDVVHVHWPFPHGVMGVAAARATGAGLVMNCHGAEFALARRKAWVRPLLAWALRRADVVIANSGDTADQVRSISGCEATILPYGTTVEANAEESGTRQPGPARLLFTGRLIERKGVEYLLHAMARLVKRHEASLVITGDGDQRKKLEALSAELGLSRYVQFAGFVSNDRLNNEYSKCDIWVNPSVIDSRGDTEGLGVGSIEAYAHRKPVVASAVGGIPDTVLQGETGLLVPERDSVALANAIGKLIDNPALRSEMGEAGIAFAKIRFDWDTITDGLVSAYKRAKAIAAKRTRASKLSSGEALRPALSTVR